MIRTRVSVPGKEPPRLLDIRVNALASSEVYWNGRLIGRNGRPAARPELEEPGRIEAVFQVPGQWVRPGENSLVVLMSSHHSVLRFRNPVHGVTVSASPAQGRPLGDYALALIALGVLLVGVVYFGTLWWLRRADRASLLLAGAAAAAACQLGAEVVRGFVAYFYPLHALRVGLIAGSAAAFGLLLVAFCAVRFSQRGARTIVLATVAASAAALLLTPGFDNKALLVLVIGSSTAAFLAWSGWRAGEAGAGPALAGLSLFPGLVILSGRVFLDQTFYLALVLLALLLFASQGLALRREQGEREALRLRASQLEVEALKRRLRQLVVHQWGRREVVDLDEVVAIRGADDYAELILADGRTRLLGESLAALSHRLPDDFLRVHRSAIVNLRCVRELARRSGGGQDVVLTTGLAFPVGRTFSKQVRAALRLLGGELE